MLPESSIVASLQEIRGRYARRGLPRRSGKIGLDAALRAAIERDLKVEAVLERVASQSAAVSETDVEIFYLMHRERFLRPETRALRHILVTINDSLPGNERPSARSRIDDIHARLAKSPERFANRPQALGMPHRHERRRARQDRPWPALRGTGTGRFRPLRRRAFAVVESPLASTSCS
jgi:hypothetical protein